LRSNKREIMAQATPVLPHREGFGATQRRDVWWLGPLLTVLGLTAFLLYGVWAAWQGAYFEIRKNSPQGGDFYAENNPAIAPYLAPFYAPLIYDPSPASSQSPHAWFHGDLRPAWLPAWFPFSAAFLILIFPGMFRLTCYYYRKAYYRSFWADPPACAVGEPRHSYWGENFWPLLFQNSHRYWMYAALVFLVLLGWDALLAFWWPTDRAGNLLPHGQHQFGVGLGSLIMVANVILLAGFTLGCNSVRHLVGGRLDCFSCPRHPDRVRPRYRLWRWVSRLNEHHMEWAWLSLFSVAFTDLYIRLCAMGIWHDLRLF
jgi:hypothetical protein